MRSATTVTRLLLAITLMTVGPLVLATTADAKITRVQITTRETPTFGGYAWPGVGQYEKIVGVAFGEVDPANPQNALITDIALAPKNVRGNVEYSFDFYILKPVDLSKGNHKVMYEPPNRGRKTYASLARFSGGNDPGSVIDPVALGNAFLMPRGYTMVWSGWDVSAGNNGANFNTRIGGPAGPNTQLAVATNGGATITGPAYEYIVTSGTGAFALNYPAANPADKVTAVLTHRVHLDDVPVVVPASGWAYNGAGTTINLVPPGWVSQDIYELSYTAKNPTVNGPVVSALFSVAFA